MALDVAVGQFGTTTGTSNIVVSGLGFQPKAVKFWWSHSTSAGQSDDGGLGWGWATSSTARWAINYAHLNGATAFNSFHHHDAACVSIYDSVQNLDGLLDLVSMDSGGFTLAVDDAFTADYQINYMAIGGSSLVNVAVGTNSISFFASTDSVSGLGFQPNFYEIGSTTATSTPGFGTYVGMGWTDGTTEMSLSWEAANNVGTSDTESTLTTDHVYAGVAEELTHSSFDSGGFTVTIGGTTGNGGYDYGWCAMEVEEVAVGTQAMQTSTGNFSNSSTSFTPSALFMGISATVTANETAASDGISLAVGGAASSTARGSVAAFNEHGQTTADTQQAHRTDQVLDYFEDRSSHVSGNRASCDLVSFNSDGFTLNMTDAADQGDLSIWWVIGATGGAATAIKDIIGGTGIIPFAR